MQPPSSSVTSRHVAKGVGTTLIARLSGVIDVFAQPLYVWLFGLASFGLYAVLWAAVNLVENVADLGMTSAMQRTVPQAESDAQAVAALAAAIVLGVAPCLVIAAGASLFAAEIAPLVNVSAKDAARLVPAIRLFAWALPLWAFVEIATSALRARRLFGPEIRLRLFWEQVARLALAVLFWTLGFGITGLFVAHMLSLGITCALAVRLLARHYRLALLRDVRWRDPIVAETARAGLAVLPTNIVQQLFTDGPTVALNLVLPGAAGATAAALFGISRKIASLIQLFRTAFAYVLAPLASAARRDAAGEVQMLYAYTTRLTAVLVIPAALVMAAGAPAILRLFGRQADVALTALVILIFARMIEAISGPAKPVQQVVSGYGQQLPASILGLLLTLAIGWLAVPRGAPAGTALAGTALAVSAGIVAAATIPVWQLHHNDALSPFDRSFGRMMMRSIGVALAGMLVALAVQRVAPAWLRLPLLAPLLLAAIWASCRLALPHADRATLGKAARWLRLA